MSSYRTTTAYRLWLTLVVVFALYVAGPGSFEGNDSRALNAELEIKAAVLAPDNGDGPASSAGIQQNDNQPGGLTQGGSAAIETLCARDDADTGTHIRGPPAGKRHPA